MSAQGTPTKSPTPILMSPRDDSYHLQTSQRYNFWQTSQKSLISLNFSQDDNIVRNKISQRSQTLMKGSCFSPILPSCGDAQQDIVYCSQIRPPSFDWIVYQDDDVESVSQYCEGIICEYRKNDLAYSPRENLFSKQSEIGKNDRLEMIKWMISKTITFKLSSRTLFLAVKIFDRLLVAKKMKKEKLLLYTVCCLSIASKYNNSFYPQLSAYVKEVNGAFKEDDIIEKELKVINYLNFQISCTTQTLFVRYWLNKLKAQISHARIATFIGICSLVSDELAIIDTELVAAAVTLITLNTFEIDYRKTVLAKIVEKLDKEKLKSVVKSIVELVNIEKENDKSPILQLFTDEEGDNVCSFYDYTIPEID